MMKKYGNRWPAVIAAVLLQIGLPVSAQETGAQVEVYKSPTCGCCTAWSEHMRDAGFRVHETKREDMTAIKSAYGVPEPLSSCHTAVIEGYIIEGHVPAADVRRLLRERPDVAGLTAPGMPMQSPGMQPKGLPPKGYTVYAFRRDGSRTVFSRY